MHYVYLLQSEAEPERFYVGSTSDLKVRMAEHNDGQSAHTSKFIPWKLRWYCAFETQDRAEAFEQYLKSGSGRAFQLRHL